MKYYTLVFVISCLARNTFAALTVVDRHKLATVTLHTELIEASKRVYLAADFEAKHQQGLIGCQLTVEHKNGLSEGPNYRLEESTSLLPKESIPFNLGLFPARFHASGLDVKAELVCRRVTFFEGQQKKTTTLKGNLPLGTTCCRLSALQINCASPPGNVSVDVEGSTQLTPTVTAKQPNEYPSCWPEQD